MNIAHPKRGLALKSYLFALAGCLLLTGANAISDIYSAHSSINIVKVLSFHFFSAMAYAIPISGLVYYILNKGTKHKRLKTLSHLLIYLVLTVIGFFIGYFIAALFVPDNSDLGSIWPLMFGSLLGAIVFPVGAHFIYKYTHSNNH